MPKSCPKTSSSNSYWYDYGHDKIIDLGNMKKAIVVALYGDGLKHGYKQSQYYAISPRSYFPFTDDQMSIKFDTPQPCMDYSIEIVKEWLQSVMNMTKNVDNLYIG